MLTFIQNGWPKNRDQIAETVRPYYIHRHELKCINGIILKGTRMLVPKTLRNELKRLLYTGHLGIFKPIDRTKKIIYWPGINNYITNIVNACEICLEHRNKQKQELITPHDIPNTPWTKIMMDFFHLGRKPYLTIVNYTTNFFDISQLPEKLPSTVVIHAKHLFF